MGGEASYLLPTSAFMTSNADFKARNGAQSGRAQRRVRKAASGHYRT